MQPKRGTDMDRPISQPFLTLASISGRMSGPIVYMLILDKSQQFPLGSSGDSNFDFVKLEDNIGIIMKLTANKTNRETFMKPPIALHVLSSGQWCQAAG
jgi:hypothetical protein